MTARKKAGANCCVVGCKNNTLNSPGTRFYVFSKVYYKKAQTDKWIEAVQRKNPDGSPWEPKKYSRICSQHFIGNKKSDHPFSPSFVPTIFPETHQSFRSAENPARLKFNMAQSDLLQSTCNSIIRASRELGDTPQLQHVDEDVPSVSQMHRQTQVNFTDTTDLKIFICNRYVDGKTCEAEIQASFPRNKDSHDDRNKQRESNSVAEPAYRDAAVGSQFSKLHQNPSLRFSLTFHGFSSVTTDREMLNLTGVTLETFDILLKILRSSKRLKISQEDRLLIFLSKIKLGLAFSALSFLFNVDKIMISRVFHSTLRFLSQACRSFLLWPSREIVQSTMSTALKNSYENCRVIVNCMEMKVEKPGALEQRVQLYSDNKNTFTIKTLIGCTPNGLISFVSRCYDGRTTDSQIVSRSGFLELLEPRDIVVTVGNSREITVALEKAGKDVLLEKSGIFNEDMRQENILSSVHSQTARTLQRIKRYRILSNLTVKTLPYADDILFMCCVLVNLQSKNIDSKLRSSEP